MIDTVPQHIHRSAKSDIDYMLKVVNEDESLDAELLDLRLELEDGYDGIFDVSVYSIISFGYDPRQHIDFEWDYFVEGDIIKFWNHMDINTLAIELANEIAERRLCK